MFQISWFDHDFKLLLYAYAPIKNPWGSPGLVISVTSRGFPDAIYIHRDYIDRPPVNLFVDKTARHRNHQSPPTAKDLSTIHIKLWWRYFGRVPPRQVTGIIYAELVHCLPSIYWNFIRLLRASNLQRRDLHLRRPTLPSFLPPYLDFLSQSNILFSNLSPRN